MKYLHRSGVRGWIKGVLFRGMPGMINCVEFEEFVLSYLDGELPARQLKVFERHMRLCRECREYLAAYRLSSELSCAVLGTPQESVPEDVPEDLIKAILDARQY